jgi:hypothetical protein
MSQETQKLRGRPVTYSEARASAQRLINSHFGGSPDPARTSIPARFSDDDLTIIDFIEEQAAARVAVIHVERAELAPGKKELLTFLARPEDSWGPAEYGLVICDVVRHIANAFKVPDKNVWYWIEKERAKHTTPIIQIHQA